MFCAFCYFYIVARINSFIHLFSSVMSCLGRNTSHTRFFVLLCVFFFYMICTIFCILYFLSRSALSSGCRSNCILWFLNPPLSLIYGPDEASGAQTCVTCEFIFPSSVMMPADSVFQLLMAYCSEVNIDPCALVYCVQFVFVLLDPSHP